MFKGATPEGLEMFLNNFLKIEIKANYPLFKEGDMGTLFYIIFKGEFEIVMSEKHKRTKILKQGATFGELALLQKSKRTASAICSMDAVLFYVDGHLLRSILSDMNKEESNERLYFVSLISIFSTLLNFIYLRGTKPSYTSQHFVTDG